MIPFATVGPTMVMLPSGVLPGACLARFVSMNTKLFGEAAQVSVVLAPTELLTRVKFKLNNVPDPESGVDVVENAEMRSVLIVPAPRTLPLTFQFVAVNPAVDAGVAWKVTTDESNVKSPWNPTRLSDALMFVVVTASVKSVTFVLTFPMGKETVATEDGVSGCTAAEFARSRFASAGVTSPVMSPTTSA